MSAATTAAGAIAALGASYLVYVATTAAPAAPALNFNDGKNRRIVIAGGGYAGLEVARELEKRLGNAPVEILIVEKRDQFNHNAAGIRAVVEKEAIARVWVPYDKAFKSPNVRVRTNTEIESVDRRSLTTTTGDTIPFDYLVVATGSWSPQPGKFQSAGTAADAISVMERLFEAIAHKETKRVLIVGAGAVGCELAGEIATDYPDKAVTLLEAAPTVLPGRSVSTGMRSSVKSSLQRLGVEVITGVKADLTKDDLSGQWNGPKKRSIRTSDGRELVSDLQIFAVGNAVLNSEVLSRRLSHLIDSQTKEIRIRPTFQVDDESLPWMLALGDVAKASGAKTVISVNLTAPLLAENIVRLLRAEHAVELLNDEERSKALNHVHLKRMAKVPFAMIVMAGRRGGATQLPFKLFGEPIVLGDFVTALLKSRTAFIPMTRKKMGYSL